MHIDWFTVGAQALNFLILVWLMKRFLYKPILNAIDMREKRIETELATADAKKAEALEERNKFQQKNDEFDSKRSDLLSQVTEEMKVQRQRLLDDAHKAADNLNAKQKEKLRSEAHDLTKTINRRTRQEVFAIARKVLMDLGTTTLEERLCEIFTRRLQEMDGKTKKDLAESFRTSSDPAILQSAFEMPLEQRTIIQNALNETFSAEIQVRFEVEPDLISGIELTTNGVKIAWSISDYLTSLENTVDELLKEKDKPDTKVETKLEDVESKKGSDVNGT